MPKSVTFRVLNGISVPDPKNGYEYTDYAPGDFVTDVPAKDVPWLIEQGHIGAEDTPWPPLPQETPLEGATSPDDASDGQVGPEGASGAPEATQTPETES